MGQLPTTFFIGADVLLLIVTSCVNRLFDSGLLKAAIELAQDVKLPPKSVYEKYSIPDVGEYSQRVQEFKKLILEGNILSDTVILTTNVFKKFSQYRGVCKAFYFTFLDSWPLLQEECIKQLKLFMIQHPKSLSFEKTLDTIDSSLNKAWVQRQQRDDRRTAAWSVFRALRQRLMRHLRYHCAPYFMMLFSNDMKIIDNKIMDTDGIPTLRGFAYYLDESFGTVVNESFCKRSCSEIIALFYDHHQVPVWNMLFEQPPLEYERRVPRKHIRLETECVNGSKNLESYLRIQSDKVKMRLDAEIDAVLGKLMCAPANLFADEKWPCVSGAGSLKNYICKCNEFATPPIRQCQFGGEELIVGITLPVRLLLREDDDNNTKEWLFQTDFFTMTITTEMLTECCRFPIGDFYIGDRRGNFISAQNFLLPGQTLSPQMFQVWAEVLLSYAASEDTEEDGRRARAYKLPLFRNFVSVQESIKELLPTELCIDHYIEDQNIWEHSPLRDDWGYTRSSEGVDWHVLVDDMFLEDFQNGGGTRDQWAPTTFFDMSISTVNDNMMNISKATADPYDLTSLMEMLDINAPHHTFPSAAKMTITAPPKRVKKRVNPNEQQKSKQQSKLPKPYVVMQGSSNSLDFFF